MANSVNTDFTLPRDAYATFDALTLKQHIKDRLNEGGVFTDQNFEGSNLSSLIDIVAFSYHTYPTVLELALLLPSSYSNIFTVLDAVLLALIVIMGIKFSDMVQPR